MKREENSQSNGNKDNLNVLNPHDKFVKEILTDKENAVDFFREVLPEKIKRNIDWTSLNLDKQSYIDEKLKEYYSDIVYNCKYGKGAKIKVTLLFEHKSFVPEYTHLQLLRYMINIWETSRKQKDGLVPIIPVIFYHGKETWEVKGMKDYFEIMDNGLEEFVPDFKYLLMDLSKYTDEEIKDNIIANVGLKTAVLFIKNIFDESKLRENMQNYLEISKIYCEEEKGLNFLKSLIVYLYSSTEMEVEEITREINSISRKGGELTMTTAEKLIEKGVQQGMQQGMQQGIKEKSIEIAKKMIKDGFSVEVIMKYTNLSKEEIDKNIIKH